MVIKPIDKTIEVVNKYWLPFTIGIVAIPILYRYYKSQVAQNEVNATRNVEKINNIQNKKADPKVLKSKSEAILSKYKFSSQSHKQRVNTASKQLAHHLGTAYMTTSSWYDLSINHLSWSENDKSVETILKQQGRNYQIISELYYSVYTQSRNLSVDINKFLDKSNLENVKAYWKTIGIYHL